MSVEIFNITLEEYTTLELYQGLTKRMEYLVTKATLDDCMVRVDSKFGSLWKSLEDDYYKNI